MTSEPSPVPLTAVHRVPSHNPLVWCVNVSYPAVLAFTRPLSSLSVPVSLLPPPPGRRCFWHIKKLNHSLPPESRPQVPVVRVDDTHFALSQLARAFYDDPSRKMLTVGITGTNGKTTTSWLVRGILEEAEHLTGMVGTIEYALCNQLLSDDGQLWKDTPEGQERDIQDIIQEEWDAIHFESKAAEEGRVRLLAHALPYHVDKYQGRYSVPNTTPNALQIQQLMAGMADRGGSACVMECSSIGLDQGRCDGVDFDVAVFMNLSQDHLDYHGTMENYLAAKARSACPRCPVENRAQGWGLTIVGARSIGVLEYWSIGRSGQSQA